MAARVVAAFGRFNPPTMGHEYLVARLNQLARQQGGIPQLYLSHSYDPKTDPLHYAEKLAFCQDAFGRDIVKNITAHTIIDVMQSLERQGFKEVVYVAGQDRVAEFDELLHRYNKKEYNFASIKVVSAGQRDPDAPGIAGMSASKLRAHAAENNLKAFVSGAPSQLSYAERVRMFYAVRHGMNLQEGIVEGEFPDLVGIVAGDEPLRNVDEIFEIVQEPLFTKLKRALAHA